MTPRLEAIDERHPDVVALMVGPLVLFGDQAPGLTRAQLLAAKRMAPGLWHAGTGGVVLKFLTWTLIEDQPYTTYLKVA